MPAAVIQPATVLDANDIMTKPPGTPKKGPLISLKTVRTILQNCPLPFKAMTAVAHQQKSSVLQ
jgi:hypothetical protein